MEAGPTNKLNVLDHVEAPPIAAGSGAMTATVEIPPGDAGSPPHRHSGPVFGYMLQGEMLFELEGEEPRVIRAGDAFWEPGGDVVHWQAKNLLQDGWSTFVVVMMCAPGVEMLTFLSPEERAERQHLRHPSAQGWR